MLVLELECSELGGAGASILPSLPVAAMVLFADTGLTLAVEEAMVEVDVGVKLDGTTLVEGDMTAPFSICVALAIAESCAMVEPFPKEAEERFLELAVAVDV